MPRKTAQSAPMLRKPLSVKTRFETFKRDDFTCRYCGRKTPAVVLQVDHIVPVCDGGDNEIENLATSCVECNQGKSGNPLTSLPVEAEPETRAILLLERERQLREYNEVKKLVLKREELQLVELRDFWNTNVCRERDHAPFRNVLRYYLKRIPVEDIKESILMAVDRVGCGSAAAYLVGILKSQIASESE